MDDNGKHLSIVPYVAQSGGQSTNQELVSLIENQERRNDGILVIHDPTVNARPVRQSRAPRKPIVVKRKMRTKLTRQQEDIMEQVTDEIIGWDSRNHDREEAKLLCQQMGISLAYYLQWVRDMKQFRAQEKEAARMEKETEAEVAESLLLLSNSEPAP